MFRDVFGDRFEVRVHRTETLMWEWEIWDLLHSRLLESSASMPDGRYLSSRDAFRAGCDRAASVAVTAA